MELYNFLKFMTRKATCSSEDFDKYVVIVFRMLKNSIANPCLQESIRGKYTALIYSHMHFFYELKYTAIHTNKAIPLHAVNMTNIISSLDAHNIDINAVFTLLSISLQKEEAITFDDQENIVEHDEIQSFDMSVAQRSKAPVDFISPPKGEAGRNSLRYDNSSDEEMTRLGLHFSDALSASTGGGGKQDDDFEDDEALSIEGVHFADASEEVNGASSSQSEGSISAPPLISATTTIEGNQEPARRTSVETFCFFFSDPIRLQRFINWKRRRLLVCQKYAALERERIKLFKRETLFKLKCTKRLWIKVQRKLRSEVLTHINEFQSLWKLGVDEGVFPGRERVVLRRKYHMLNIKTASKVEDRGEEDGISSSLKDVAAIDVQSLSKVLVNYIQDTSVVSSDAGPLEQQDGGDRGRGQAYEGTDEDEKEEQNGNPKQEVEQLPEDGDDLGMAGETSRSARVATGPSYSGARRLNFGPVMDEAEVVLITPSGNYVGKMAFSKRELSFVSSNSLMAGATNSEPDASVVAVDASKKFTRRRWTVSAISLIFLRRYRLRDTALEVFFRRGKHRNFFIDFGFAQDSAKRRDAFARSLMKVAPSTAFKQWPAMPTLRVASELGVVSQWQNGEISNFEYLMALNTCAGRSYNDLCQVNILVNPHSPPLLYSTMCV